ncbi:MAG: tripartite tricarboxylate transporter substrate binding protein [Betaproteobacteria bacterium]|nr:tripartite tricarboxylate transporter substrate binding protein [Betaproteobacteria bacterium]
MKSVRRSLLRVGLLLAGAIGATVAATPAGAQSDYPARSVRIVVPYPPGGAPDILARMLSLKYADALGQPFVVENRPGAAGNIGTDHVAKSAPNGYTLLFASDGPLTISPNLSKVPYDPVGDFTPITLATTNVFYLLATPAFPANSVQDLVAIAKANPGKYNFASGGIGSPHHLIGELFHARAGVKLVHVPYNGFPQAVSDVISGKVEITYSGLAGSSPYIKAGKLKALGVTGTSRFAGTPDVPTIGESGFPGFEATFFYGLLGPPGMPRDIVSRLEQQTSRALRSKDVAERVNSIGMDVVASTPEEFSARIRADLEKWAKVLRSSGAKAE